jgi:hypothetical protein
VEIFRPIQNLVTTSDMSSRTILAQLLEGSIHNEPCTACGRKTIARVRTTAGSSGPHGSPGRGRSKDVCMVCGNVQYDHGPMMQSPMSTSPRRGPRDFSMSDWDAFSGAEMPDGENEGEEPQIDDIHIDGHPGAVIADRTQVQICFSDDVGGYRLMIPFDQGRVLMKKVKRCSTVQELIDMGFTPTFY